MIINIFSNKCIEDFTFQENLLSHRNNILNKFKISDDIDHQNLCGEILIKYNDFIKIFERNNLDELIHEANLYLNYIKDIESKYRKFNWRSNFASSFIPELIYRLFSIVLTDLNLPNFYSTKDSIVEISLSPSTDGGWDIRKKDQDLCLGVKKDFYVKNSKLEEFLVPLIALEVKTNIDINKLNGLEYSAERLKKTFPSSKYFLVTETIDFSLDKNYASSQIDEIYVLRKQVRSQARRSKYDLRKEVFLELLLDTIDIVSKANIEHGHVYNRLPKGKLVNV